MGIFHFNSFCFYMAGWISSDSLLLAKCLVYREVFLKSYIWLLLIDILVYSWYVSLLCQTLEGRSQISNWISDILTYCPRCPNCDKFYTSRCSDAGQVRLVPPCPHLLSLTKSCWLAASVHQPAPGYKICMYLVQNDIQNIEMFIKFFDTGHCTHTYPDYMRNGEPLKTVRRIDIQISQFDLKHVFSGFK